MKSTYKHTNIIAGDWRALAKFYQDVFGCIPVPPERDLSGTWLEKGTGIPGARFSGAHLRLPGHGETGPTLEIFQYAKNEPRPKTVANREGISHLAFQVDDIEQGMAEVLNHGGREEPRPKVGASSYDKARLDWGHMLPITWAIGDPCSPAESGTGKPETHPKGGES
jgi:catechol 2,3-dioxygenase-like lactoylglutathione lyase family enzyme